MVLRLLVYWALGIDAGIRREFVIAWLCLVIPFARAPGMLLAVLVGVLFIWKDHYIEGGLAIGMVIFNLVGNDLMDRWLRRWEHAKK